MVSESTDNIRIKKLIGYDRNKSTTKISGLTPNEMRERVHTAPVEVKGLVPMQAADVSQGEGKLYALSAAPQFDLSNRLKDAFRNKEPLVGIEHKGRRYTVKCNRVTNEESLQDMVSRMFKAKQTDQTVLGVDQAGRQYCVEITPLGQTVEAPMKQASPMKEASPSVGGKRGRGRPRGSKTRKRKSEETFA